MDVMVLNQFKVASQYGGVWTQVKFQDVKERFTP